MSHSSRNNVKRESEDESMATPTGPSDEPTDLSVGGGREREERDRERQERERYYRCSHLFAPTQLFCIWTNLSPLPVAVNWWSVTTSSGDRPSAREAKTGRSREATLTTATSSPRSPSRPSSSWSQRRSSAQHLHLVQWVGDRLRSQQKSTAIKTQWKLCCQSVSERGPGDALEEVKENLTRKSVIHMKNLL